MLGLWRFKSGVAQIVRSSQWPTRWLVPSGPYSPQVSLTVLRDLTSTNDALMTDSGTPVDPANREPDFYNGP
ncbi:hypothetical protein PHO31112_02615 [Pandoraea horticolens]|uniref:Uncharacterized protein n=1 Tax=Pandoraea horticolens TaxID=2508298 RepID=A0A5E4VIB9_9BURK|nr:hypothetical protein PHO31112_02615 [Pandoraea horticolens]